MRATCVAAFVLTASLPAHAEEDPCEYVVVAPSSTLPVRGKLRAKSNAEPLVGGTVVVSPIGGGDVQTAISDEQGRYAVQVPPGTYTITVYYLDVTVDIATNLAIASSLDLGDHVIDDTRTSSGFGCIFTCTIGPEMSSQPYFGLTVSRQRGPVARDRTHVASVELVTAADVRTVVTTLERGVRLHGAPAVPTIFVEEVGVSTLRTEIVRAAGSGGAGDVALRSGSNEVHADARLVLGLDRSAKTTDRVLAQEAFLGAPIKKDSAWIGVGLVADLDRRAHGLVRFNFAGSPEHQGEVIALAQDAGTARDGWGQGRWTSKLFDNRLQIRATATGERLELAPSAVAHATTGPTAPLGDLVQRAGGALDLTYRFKAAGHHNLTLLAASGAGSVDETRHRDLSLAAGDSWQIKPNLTFDYGVRSDLRTFAGQQASVVSPRVSLAYDLTQEGRSDLFVAVQRVPHLDDGFIGAWLARDARFHDEVAVGISHMFAMAPSVMVGIAGRAQRRDTPRRDSGAEVVDHGIDGWARYEKGRTFVHATVSTLRRAASLQAQRRLLDCSGHELAVATAVWTAEPRELEVDRITEGGGALAWSWRPQGRTGAKVTTSIEGYGGTVGPGARLVLGGTW